MLFSRIENCLNQFQQNLKFFNDDPNLNLDLILKKIDFLNDDIETTIDKFINRAFQQQKGRQHIQNYIQIFFQSYLLISRNLILKLYLPDFRLFFVTYFFEPSEFIRHRAFSGWFDKPKTMDDLFAIDLTNIIHLISWVKVFFLVGLFVMYLMS